MQLASFKQQINFYEPWAKLGAIVTNLGLKRFALSSKESREWCDNHVSRVFVTWEWIDIAPTRLD